MFYFSFISYIQFTYTEINLRQKENKNILHIIYIYSTYSTEYTYTVNNMPFLLKMTFNLHIKI